MRSRIFLTVLFTVLFVFLSGCGTSSSCPICGTDQYGAYANVDQIAVPEHNPTGEPGGPFNSFDISSVAPNPAVAGHYLDYISDRIGLDMVVIDTEQDLAVNAIQGANSVAGAGDGASACFQVTVPSTTPGGTPTTADVIPPDIDVYGNFTRFACRSDMSTATLGAPLPPTTIPGPTFHLNTGFGANHLWGGFPGAQCCASRANGVNPMSGAGRQHHYSGRAFPICWKRQLKCGCVRSDYHEFGHESSHASNGCGKYSDWCIGGL